MGHVQDSPLQVVETPPHKDELRISIQIITSRPAIEVAVLCWPPWFLLMRPGAVVPGDRSFLLLPTVDGDNDAGASALAKLVFPLSRTNSVRLFYSALPVPYQLL